MNTSDDILRARRSSPRLTGFDYSQEGYYFVTACTRNQQQRFGTVTDGVMYLSPIGEIVANEWLAIPSYETHVHLDAWVVMPNHLHGIISIHAVGDEQSHGLSTIVSGFKGRVSRQVNQMPQPEGISLWQRSFYDHVIRTDADLDRIREYIANNPARWMDDRFHT